MDQIVVAAFYRFVRLPDFEELREPLLQYCRSQQIKGTLLLAPEGLNGTVAGNRVAIDHLLNYLRQDSRFAAIKHKESLYDHMPFYRMKVKLKKEIVTMGVADIDPRQMAGTYVQPEDWNDLISDPEVTVIDTRNAYEVAIGTFKGAIDPGTTCFRDFPRYVAEKLDPRKQKKVAMFCTGGIRCEKSTAYLKTQGFEEVYHLQGGILQYLENIPAENSLWEGECFVFDNRVAVNQDLRKGSYDQCYACRHPITEEDKRSEYYLPGVACPFCYHQQTAGQQARFRERQKQIELADARCAGHIGLSEEQLREARRIKKARREAKQSDMNQLRE